jgi:hypothetical protein
MKLKITQNEKLSGDSKRVVGGPLEFRFSPES